MVATNNDIPATNVAEAERVKKDFMLM